MTRNPFGDDPGPERVNPFGDDVEEKDPVERLQYATRRIQALRSRVGSDGLTAADQRQLLDQLANALDSAVRAFRDLRDGS